MKNLSIQVDQLLRRRFFFTPTASIYGGVSGLYDYGPLGVALKSNIISLWRQHFYDQNIYEIDSCILTPYEVLKASGHVDKFADLLVFDSITGECYRADHLLEAELGKLPVNEEIKSILNQVETLKPDEIDGILKKYDIKSAVGNAISGCTPFNLIFTTQVGAKARLPAFLRPETAQGQFVNFKKLYEMNGEKLPFGSFSIGKVFRNEISPRSSILRVREFEQAEIEYYVHPDEKSCERFHELPDIKLNLHYLQGESQKTIKSSLKSAVKQKIVDNETLGFFIGKTFLFLLDCGIKEGKIRFRQHKKDEMAHYACDCWDAEIQTSYGWIECVGIADRSCYDLKMHQNASGINLHAQRKLETPIFKSVWKAYPDRSTIGKELRQDFKDFLMKIEEIPADFIDQNIITTSENNGTLNIEFKGTHYNVEYKKVDVKISVEDFLPTVIEPSFGIGRILYALVENSFYQRDSDPERIVLSLPYKIAPIKCVISTVVNKHQEYRKIIKRLEKSLSGCNIEYRCLERSVSIGKKYASNDEIGVPFFITIDPESLNDDMVTIRERDSMKQVRVSVEEVGNEIILKC